jgi:anaerobic ribonucleoside-triphosphate reductase
MIAKKTFNMEELWTWFLRIVMGLVSFILIETYNDIKQIGKDLGDVKVMVAQSQKDIEYLKDDQKTFKNETKTRLTFLEQKK